MALANPGARCLLVRKTQVSLTSTALVTWKRDVIPETLEAGAVEYYGGSREEPAQYRYSNGSCVVLGGMDKSTKIMSSEWDVIYVQEATELSEDDWEKLTTRLRSNMISFQQILGDCNPDRPTHWIKKRCDQGLTVLLESRHEDNPTLYDEDGNLTDSGAPYMAALDRLTGTRRQRLRFGLWVGVEGNIYPEFDSAVHLIDPYPIPDDWNRYWSVDFGFVRAFVCQHWAEAPDGELILYREFYGTQRLVSDWANLILDTITDDTCPTCCGHPDAGPCSECGDIGLVERYWTEPRPVAIVCDHDAEGRAAFARVIGQQTVAAHKAVSDGIQAVQERLTERRLLLMRDVTNSRDEALQGATLPTSTADEFPGYVWANHQTKEQPVKENDHGMDALRYVVAQRDLGSRPGVRFL
jgi:phage terminase large subunit